MASGRLPHRRCRKIRRRRARGSRDIRRMSCRHSLDSSGSPASLAAMYFVQKRNSARPAKRSLADSSSLWSRSAGVVRTPCGSNSWSSVCGRQPANTTLRD